MPDTTEREPFATTSDLATLWRPMTADELYRAENLLPIVSDSLRYEAIKIGKNLDDMQEKLDIFLAAGKLTIEEYEELVELLHEIIGE